MGNDLKDILLMSTSDPSSLAHKTPDSIPQNQKSDLPDLDKLQQAIEHIKEEWQKRKVTRWWQRLLPGQGQSRAPWRNRLGECTALLESCQCVSHFEKSKSLEFLYWIGIVILCLLLLNVGGLLVAFGTSFFRHPGYILDLLVLTTALCLEIFLDAETAGLLVILTLWRIVRVAHGIFEVTDEAMEAELHKIESQFEALELENKKMQELLKEKDHRIAELEQA